MNRSAWDNETLILFASIGALLLLGSMVAAALGRKAQTASSQATVRNLKERIGAWWIMVLIFAFATLMGQTGALILFGLVSFWALREFITLTPTRRGDHRALFWTFFIFTPLQYYLLAIDWYHFFIVLIPVYAFLFIPVRTALAGDCERFLERTAKIQWALMICVYCISHAPALLTLPIRGYEGENGKLLLFMVVVAQMSDVLQYVWGKACGGRKIAPRVTPGKTWAGFIGGIASATVIGMLMTPITPFSWWQAGGMAFVVAVMGFAGGLTMSAIKRDHGVKDYGDLIQGHGGMLDRVDSIAFAAPVFFHLTRWLFT